MSIYSFSPAAYASIALTAPGRSNPQSIQAPVARIKVDFFVQSLALVISAIPLLTVPVAQLPPPPKSSLDPINRSRNHLLCDLRSSLFSSQHPISSPSSSLTAIASLPTPVGILCAGESSTRKYSIIRISPSKQNHLQLSSLLILAKLSSSLHGSTPSLSSVK